MYLINQDEGARLAGEEGEKSTQRTRATGASRREEGWAPREGEEKGEEGGRLGPQGRGDSVNWGGRSALVCSVCTVDSDADGGLDVGQG